MDLDLLQDLSKFIPATIKIQSKTTRNINEGDEEDGFSCSTPTSQEHKIPPVLDSPPPPPRKPRPQPSKPSATAALMIRSWKRLTVSSPPFIVTRRPQPNVGEVILLVSEDEP
ncbi:hypothetical protein Bca101_089901 [Brassica carinata]